MAKQRRKAAARSVVDSYLSPDSHVTLSIRQVLTSVAAIAVAAGGYYYLVTTQANQGKDIADIKSTVTAVTMATASSSKEQDTKREQMGKDFLASTEKIAEKVGDLNTALAVQQDQTKHMADTLTTISNQLGNLTSVQSKK